MSSAVRNRTAGGTLRRRIVVMGLPHRGEFQKEEIVDMLRSLPLRAYLALRSARDREEGQALVEYALILFLVALVCIAILGTLGGAVSSMFSTLDSEIP